MEKSNSGERGMNISGGQRGRISLVRACYSSSKVVLLDDPIAAVDVPTARHLMDHVLSGIFKGRTVILVTRNKVAQELCDKVFLMQNGELKEVGLEEEAIREMFLEADDEQESDEKISGSEEARIPLTMETSSELHAGLSESVVITRTGGDSQHSSRRTSSSLREIVASKSDVRDANVDFEAQQGKAPAQQIGGLTVQEDRVIGEVTWKTFFEFCRGTGLWLWTFVLFLMAFGQAVRVMVYIWISIAKQ